MLDADRPACVSCTRIRERIAEPNSPNRRAALISLLNIARGHLGTTYAPIWTDGAATEPALAVAAALDDRPALQSGHPSPMAAMTERVPTSVAPYTLSARELDVVAPVARGLANPDIADALVVSRRTVEWHVRNILRKLGLPSRAQLIAWARDHTFTHPD